MTDRQPHGKLVPRPISVLRKYARRRWQRARFLLPCAPPRPKLPRRAVSDSELPAQEFANGETGREEAGHAQKHTHHRLGHLSDGAGSLDPCSKHGSAERGFTTRW